MKPSSGTYALRLQLRALLLYPLVYVSLRMCTPTDIREARVSNTSRARTTEAFSADGLAVTPQKCKRLCSSSSLVFTM
jgi:hypothetical protein